MAADPHVELLQEARRALNDASAEISEAVAVLEAEGDTTQAEDFLASARSRLQILDERIHRLLDDAG